MLEKFDDHDLRQFVANWYAVQEAADPVARDEGVADLCAALDSNERVKELARNPMLATLIALVHCYKAHLPGERARLYDLCVKTMLETWPATKKRRFVEIDEGLQRAYLEELAYRMHKARDRGRSGSRSTTPSATIPTRTTSPSTSPSAGPNRRPPTSGPPPNVGLVLRDRRPTGCRVGSGTCAG